MTTIDQQFVEYIVKSLVSKPDDVEVVRRIDEKGVLLELTVDPEDLGRVIGKRGATAQSIRTLLRALGTKNDARYNLKIVDNDQPGASPAPAPLAQQDAQDDSQDDGDDQTPRDDMDLQDDAPVDDSSDEPVEEKGNLAERTRKELADLDDLRL